jgi:hypothetical protein
VPHPKISLNYSAIIWIGVSNEVVNCSRNYLEESQIITSGLKPLVLYKPNTMLFGGPNYKIPEDEVRKFFGEKPKVRNWNDI